MRPKSMYLCICPALGKPLSLNHYKSLFITKLSRTDWYCGLEFRNGFGFIDDACSINDSDKFENSYSYIYPKDLQLKYEHKGDHAIFLELDIKLKTDCLYII